MSAEQINLTPELMDYLISMSSPEHPLLQALTCEATEIPDNRMRISSYQAQFMGLLMAMLAPKSILEIGTFFGYSALAMGLGMPPEATLTTCDISNQWIGLAQIYWEKAGLSDRIHFQCAQGLEVLRDIKHQNRRFDFIFIDADKQAYPEYASLALECLPIGGVLAMDNVLWKGKVVDEVCSDPRVPAIRACNAILAQAPGVMVTVLPIGDGLTLARKC